eukprot:TRINITY_DN2258_c1_g1_i1.p1 TRINITY_DN2258_c1_g1~~TRINITY_DN2258_c1_g1_i1.p1  ORF type:complete len:334 (+),score=36.18 TRINITY_DN2258_c1_g1_i1:116-1117(+)
MENWGFPGYDEFRDENFLKGEEGEVVLGNVISNTVDDEVISALRSKVWFSYRKGFKTGEKNGKTSDAGWGCVHRSGQMLLIAVLARHLQVPESKLLKHFMDSPSSEFSIINIASEGVPLGTRVGCWFAPSTVAKCIASLVKKCTTPKEFLGIAAPQLDVIVADQGQLYMEDIHKRATTGGVLLLIPIRLGLDAVEGQYHQIIKSCLRSQFSVGIIGGKPKHSLLFIGYRGKQLIYLDPHKVQPAYLSPETIGSITDPHRHSVPISQIDPSCLISFYLSSNEDVNLLTAQLTAMLQPLQYPIFSLLEGAPKSYAVKSDCADFDDTDEESDFVMV